MELSPLRLFPSSTAHLRGRHRHLPRSENRGRPVSRNSPLAARPMGCRFGEPSLGKIHSLSWGGFPCTTNHCRIGIPADAARLEAVLVTLPLPHSFITRDGDGRVHRRPMPFRTAPPASLPPSPHSERGDGKRSCHPSRFLSPVYGIWESRGFAPARSRGRSCVSNRGEGLPSGPPALSKPHSYEWG